MLPLHPVLQNKSSKPTPLVSKVGSKPKGSLSGEGFLFANKYAAKRYHRKVSFRRLHVELNVHVKDFPLIQSVLTTRK